MTHLINPETQKISDLHPERTYSVAMQAPNFSSPVNGVPFRNSVSQGALVTKQVLALRAYGFRFVAFPYTPDLQVCWPFGFDAEPVGYVGTETEAVQLARHQADENRKARLDAVKDARSQMGLEQRKAMEAAHLAASEHALIVAKEAEAEAAAHLEKAKAEVAEAEAAVKKAKASEPGPEPEPRRRGRPKKNGNG